MRQWTCNLIQQRMLAVFFTAVVIVFPLISQAQDYELQAQLESSEHNSNFLEPQHLLSFQGIQKTLSRASTKAFNVLDYLRKNVTYQTIEEIERSLEPYNRRNHFYGWINADPTTNCLDTRTEVLVRDADKSVQLTFKNARQCNVARGLWHDPYTGGDFKISTAIQIDHVVPLKNAYISGAAEWKTSRRCTYGNFLENSHHLLAVSGHENMSKGSKGPDGYLPPDESYRCAYVAMWTKIKAVWNLRATEEEMEAIEDVIQRYHCSPDRFEISKAEFAADRSASNDAPARCRELDQAF